ncbi:MAG TPA: hydrogenase [Rhodospirillales bacterium]|nr:hydrogenase [Rhodospirillales bacterium]
MSQPAFIAEAGDVDKLVWDPTCVHNLSLYLTAEKKIRAAKKETADKPIGIVCKGCDSRSVVVLLQENYLKRENVHIIGVSCQGSGVLDENKLNKHLKGKTPLSAEYDGDESYVVATKDGDVKIAAKEIMAERCLECKFPYPDVNDEIFGGKVESERRDPFHSLEAMEASTVGDKWDFWKKQLDGCLRCYACRSVCPMCYCEECVVDSITFMVTPGTSPEQKADRIKWIERSNSTSENFGYHMVRAIHLVGRCIDCAECERVCPVDIPLRLLNKKLEKEAFELFDYQAGLDPDQPSLVSSFRDEDPNDHIL